MIQVLERAAAMCDRDDEDDGVLRPLDDGSPESNRNVREIWCIAYALAKTILRHHHDAEDVATEATVTTIRRQGEDPQLFSTLANAKAFAGKVAKNLAKRKRKENRRRKQVEWSDRDRGESPIDRPDEIVSQEWLRDQARKFLESVPTNEAIVLYRIYVLYLNQAEAASPPFNNREMVKRVFSRARERLRRHWNGASSVPPEERMDFLRALLDVVDEAFGTTGSEP
jgi:RNA polymerase sigma factor (sigma-70 family)